MRDAKINLDLYLDEGKALQKWKVCVMTQLRA